MRILDWLKASNRWKHLIGGLILGLVSRDFYETVLIGLAVGSALEFKDKQWGGNFDYIDLICTFVGTLLGYSIRVLIINIV